MQPIARITVAALAATGLLAAASVSAQTTQKTAPKTAPPDQPAADAATVASSDDAVQLAPVTVSASADASAQGLSRAYAGGQVARGGRAGILGTRDNLETPFSITSYTNALIQDRQAKSVGDVLQSDSGVRVARGFGNFQESYIIRGFVLGSDDVAYNGLYSLLPRQYIATELFERVEVLRGASAFLTGANPGGGGIGGAINLLPKRAPNDPLTRFTAGTGNGPYGSGALDVARRFGADNAFGVRINAAYRDGDTAVDDEQAKLGLVSIGLDWRGDSARLSGDIGYQNNQLDQTRTNIQLGAVTRVPDAPDASKNYAQPWSYSNERDLFGTLRGEYDIVKNLTAYAAYGLRRSKEANSLANITVTDADTGAAETSRFDNTRKDRVDTGEVGLRGKLKTGPFNHELVFAASYFEAEKDNAYAFDFFNTLATNLYTPTESPRPDFSANTFVGNELDNPELTNRTTLTSYAVGDTLDFLDKRLLLTLGLRHQTLKVENYAYTTGDPDPSGPYDKSRLSPSVGLVVRASKQISLYANYIEGLTQGDTAPAQGGVPVKTLAPYVSKQKEVGMKFDAGKLGGGLALFTTSRPRLVIGDEEFAASGQDRHQGAELNVYGIAAPGLKVLGGVTWLDAEQQATGDAKFDGKRVIGVPRIQSNIGLEWALPVLPDMALDTRFVQTGASYYDSANALRVPGWARIDLGARYRIDVSGHELTLRARIDNVTDENYYASAGGFTGLGYLVVGAPRSFVFSVAVDL